MGTILNTSLHMEFKLKQQPIFDEIGYIAFHGHIGETIAIKKRAKQIEDLFFKKNKFLT